VTVPKTGVVWQHEELRDAVALAIEAVESPACKPGTESSLVGVEQRHQLYPGARPGRLREGMPEVASMPPAGAPLQFPFLRVALGD
jgi:hypothetical protein